MLLNVAKLGNNNRAPAWRSSEAFLSPVKTPTGSIPAARPARMSSRLSPTKRDCETSPPIVRKAAINDRGFGFIFFSVAS